MKRPRFSPTVIGFIICLGLSSPQVGQNLQPPRNQSGPTYKIGPDDVLSIFVYNDDKLSKNYTVRPDGWISFPLLKDVQAAGLTPQELSQKIEKDLTDYLLAPANVTVVVDSIRSYRVFVLGNVKNQGEIVRPSPLTVIEAITLAGGFSEFAKKEEVIVIRGKGETGKVYTFNYAEYVKTKNVSQDLILQSGDHVIVP